MLIGVPRGGSTARYRTDAGCTNRDPPRGDQVEVGHAPPEQRVSSAEVLMTLQTGQHRGEPLARLVDAQQARHGVAQGLDAFVWAAKRGLRHRVAQHAGSDRVLLSVVGV